ncbi:MAG: 1-acyl-sn-glycerol-3-phosphate acyltransferase [Gemmatimonadaceae bacterium]|nr:1-acyl-sn-glycerol-3-phosphate acyltransferase [Gemmatimonadaceae bacterium]
MSEFLSHLLAYLAGGATVALLMAGAGVLVARWWRGWTHRASLRAHKRYGARIDRFKLAGREAVIEALLDDPAVREAARAHAAAAGGSEEAAMAQVRGYLDEIVPAFSLWFYYQVGLAVAEAVLKLFFRVTVIDRRADAVARLPKDAVVVYLMNHRSNADYLLAGYALAGQVAISYAVGEWARVFPLDNIFRAFGAYFVRRHYREPLYHAVLERYVQLITSHGVTQGIFPEGGLTRDGRLREPKLGLLDYILRVAGGPGSGGMYIVPVAINYDRVLEDRALLREQMGGKRRPLGKVVQFSVVLWYIAWNAFRIVIRRWRRHGDAVVVVGEPVSLDPWFAELEARGTGIATLDRKERLREVHALASDAMRWIGELMPVPAVPLTCAAIRSFGQGRIARAALAERVARLRSALVAEGREVLDPEEPAASVADRAIEMLWIRAALQRERGSITVLPRGRALVEYYANSIGQPAGNRGG